MTQKPPQFGDLLPGRDYADRPAAFGLLARDGRIAVVFVRKPDDATWFDLPGGGVDPGETSAQAVVREYGEEAGLKVRAGEVFGLADQYFVNTEGVAWNNRSSFHRLEFIAEDASLKIEDDHTLLWLEPLEAITALRHDSHAWAVAAWLRL
ncbi:MULTISPECIES: NUDIX domain-containing protein [Phenylobacterium]|uniref:8-oxo-dGTP diphosphatase n=1 Tax=Phenylobacterium koreense TaxID=266125 RepID=A0ABV2EE25_9CAUL